MCLFSIYLADERANARNVRLYYPYWQYTIFNFIFWFVSLLCLRSTLCLFNFAIAAVQPADKTMNVIQMTSFKTEQYSIFVFGVVKYVKHELKSSCTLPRYFSCSLLHPHPLPLTPAYPFSTLKNAPRRSASIHCLNIYFEPLFFWWLMVFLTIRTYLYSYIDTARVVSEWQVLFKEQRAGWTQKSIWKM